MALCSNRFPLAGSPSTCILDTALTPLPAFLFIAVSLALLLLPRLTAPTRAPVLPKWVHILYILLLVAAFGMHALELARLVAAHQGVGLLPAILVAMLFVAAILWARGRSRPPALAAALLGFWSLMAVFMTVKVVRLARLLSVHPAKDSMYPSSDWLLDNAVILGLYVLFVIVEGLQLVASRRQVEDHERDEKVMIA